MYNSYFVTITSYIAKLLPISGYLIILLCLINYAANGWRLNQIVIPANEKTGARTIEPNNIY